MNAAALLRDLRARGLTPRLTAPGIVWEGPPAVLRPAIREALRRHEAVLTDRLQDEAEAQAAAEKVGVMMLYWHQHVDDWPDADFRRRRDLLLAWMNHLDALLARTGEPLEAYGWTVSPVGVWRRRE